VRGAVQLITFVLIQIWKPELAMVLPRIFIQRSIFSAFFVSCCIGARPGRYRLSLLYDDNRSIGTVDEKSVYHLPAWFQAVKGDSAVSEWYSPTTPSDCPHCFIHYYRRTYDLRWLLFVFFDIWHLCFSCRRRSINNPSR
jgi:hypothetical protein